MSQKKKNKLPLKLLRSDMAAETCISCAAAIITILWVGFWQLDISAPLRIKDDFVFVLFNVKSLLEYGTIYTNTSVAFPEQGNYLTFPTPDILQYFIIRFLGLFSSNPFIVLNSYIAVAFMSTALSAYFALRYSSISRWLSFCGALVFACSAYLTHRASLHPYFCLAVIMPWVCRFCILQFYQWPRLTQPQLNLKIWQSVVLGIFAGSTGLYYAFFSAFFISITIFILLLNKQPLAKLKSAGAFLIALLITFNLWLLPNYIDLFDHSTSFPARNYFEQVIYGLRLPDLLIPSLPPFLGTYQSYALTQEKMSSEGNYSILGLWGIVGFIGAIWICFSNLIQRPSVKKLTIQNKQHFFMIKMILVLMLAGILFAMPYGLGFIFNMYVDATIRAQNRIAPFLLYFAIFLTTLLLENFCRQKPSDKMPYSLYVTSLALLLATLIPNFQALADVQQSNLTGWNKKQINYTRLLQKIDERNLKAVAQYPSYPFPEGPIYKDFGNSDHFWPYLLDTATDRHWSFGSTVSQTTWQILNTIASWPAETFFISLRCLGYDALLIEKQGLTQQQEVTFESYIRTLEYHKVLLNDQERTLVDVGKDTVDIAVCNQVSAIQRRMR